MKKDRKQIAVSVVVAVLSLAVIALSAAQLLGFIEDATLINMPIMSVNCLGLAYILWDKSRKVAYLEIGVTVFLIICTLGALFVHG